MSDAGMFPRFTGTSRSENLIAELCRQDIVDGDLALAAQLASSGEVVCFRSGQTICEQGGCDDDVYFLLVGSAGVSVNGHPVATRQRGTVIGELAAVDAGAQRSATVTTITEVVALKVSAADFRKAGEASLTYWRFLARLLGQKLRDRNRFHLPANAIPIMFVGSSVESLPVARAIESGLKHDKVVVRPWTAGGVFGPSAVTLDSLLSQVEQADFAVLVLGVDDSIQSRDQLQGAPRDNVILEMGLFMGGLGRERVFMVRDADADLKIPSDLLGVNPITYKRKPGCTPSDFVGPVCNDLRSAISALGARNDRMKLIK